MHGEGVPEMEVGGEKYSWDLGKSSHTSFDSTDVQGGLVPALGWSRLRVAELGGGVRYPP